MMYLSMWEAFLNCYKYYYGTVSYTGLGLQFIYFNGHMHTKLFCEGFNQGATPHITRATILCSNPNLSYYFEK